MQPVTNSPAIGHVLSADALYVEQALADRERDLSLPRATCTWWEAVEVVNSITADTTPEEFDQLCHRYPGYRLEEGNGEDGTAMCKAAIVGNLPLIEHLWKKGGPDLLETADWNGYTPLHLVGSVCFDFKDLEMNKLVASALIRLGQNINRGADASVLWKTTAGATPLDVALKCAPRNGNLPLIQQLVLCGGKVHCKLEPNELEMINTVIKPVFGRIKCICQGGVDDGSVFSLLSADIIRLLVDNYRLVECHTPFPLDDLAHPIAHILINNLPGCRRIRKRQFSLAEKYLQKIEPALQIKLYEQMEKVSSAEKDFGPAIRYAKKIKQINKQIDSRLPGVVKEHEHCIIL